MGNICDIFNKHQDKQYSYNIPIAIPIDTPINRPINNQITDLSNNKTGLSESESESRKSQNIYKPSDPIPIPVVNAIPISSPLNSFNENSYRYPQENQNQYQYQNQYQQQPHIVVVQNRQHDDVFNTINGFFTGMLLGEILSDDCL